MIYTESSETAAVRSQSPLSAHTTNCPLAAARSRLAPRTYGITVPINGHHPSFA